jgi:Ras family
VKTLNPLGRHKRRVTTAEARDYCESNGVALVETSALDDSNVDLAFEQVHFPYLPHLVAAGARVEEAAWVSVLCGSHVNVAPGSLMLQNMQLVGCRLPDTHTYVDV